MQNVIKHAEATNALVQLNYLEGILSITVEDTGVGMKEQDNSIEENKMGLRSIRTRLKAMGGTMEIHPCTPHGTSVNIELSL
jgi:signal transduction histidine kinase